MLKAQPISRPVTKISSGTMTFDGAGVKLRRIVGSRDVDMVDPFLMLDEFKSDSPGDYIEGFPSHPHRGIETVTYMLEGRIEHSDSLGNSGVVGPGDVQWMTAGSGVIHSEMPAQLNGKLWGFQLWVNLPASQKMRKPRYQDLARSKIPFNRRDGGAEVKVIAGTAAGLTGPLEGMDVDPLFLDVSLIKSGLFDQTVGSDRNVFAYLYEGSAEFGSKRTLLEAPGLAVFGEGDFVGAIAGDSGCRFLLVAGRPLNEPVARGGPFVMNTRDEVQQAFLEYQRGEFVKKSA